MSILGGLLVEVLPLQFRDEIVVAFILVLSIKGTASIARRIIFPFHEHYLMNVF